MRVVISGGGTAGHINPAIAIGSYILKKEPDSEILYIGTDGMLEKQLYAKTGCQYKLYPSKGLLRKNIFSNFEVMYLNYKSFLRMKKDIRDFKPDIGVSAGGYISALAMSAVRSIKKPFILHEQNAYPGLATRMLSKSAKKYALAFMEAAKHLKKKDLAVLTGNPVRSEFLTITKEKAREKLGFSQDEKIVLCFGGSLGAVRLNSIFKKLAIKNAADKKYRLIIGTGERYYDSFPAELKKTNKIHIEKFINNMPEVLAACDLAITRSGAMTVSELAAMNKPSILIPSPNVTADHQTKNADVLVNAGGAVKISENELSFEIVSKTIDNIIENKEKINSMAKSLKKVAVRDADERIYKILKNVLKS